MEQPFLFKVWYSKMRANKKEDITTDEIKEMRKQTEVGKMKYKRTTKLKGEQRRGVFPKVCQIKTAFISSTQYPDICLF